MSDARRVQPDDDDRFLTPGEVAEKFRVDPKTVTRWATAGKFDAYDEPGRKATIRTLGGHRRFRESVVRRLMAEDVPNPWRQ